MPRLYDTPVTFDRGVAMATGALYIYIYIGATSVISLGPPGHHLRIGGRGWARGKLGLFDVTFGEKPIPIKIKSQLRELDEFIFLFRRPTAGCSNDGGKKYMTHTSIPAPPIRNLKRGRRLYIRRLGGVETFFLLTTGCL